MYPYTTFKVSIDRKVSFITEEFSNVCGSVVDPVRYTADDVRKAVEKVKRKKACGPDSIFNEHILYGGSIRYGKRALLYSDMCSSGYIPECLKWGIVVTIHKGWRENPRQTHTITGQPLCLHAFSSC